MTVVVTAACRLCRFTECAAVCPVACFHLDEDMVFVDPDTCIDCGACIPACPVQAISDADDLPEDQLPWIAINAEKSKTLPVLRAKLTPLPTAEARRLELGH